MPLKNYESLKLRKSSQDGCAQWAVEEQKMAEVAKRGCNGGEPSAGVFLTTRSAGVGRLSGETVANREAVTKRSFAKPEG